MQIRRTRPYSPWQNGKVERSGKILYGRKVFTSEKVLRSPKMHGDITPRAPRVPEYGAASIICSAFELAGYVHIHQPAPLHLLYSRHLKGCGGFPPREKGFV